MAVYQEIDLEVIAELRDILGDELTEMFQEFIDQSSDLLDKLEHAAGAGDLDSLITATHLLASSSGNLGFLPFSQQARTLENGCRLGAMPDPIDQVARLRAQHLRLLEEIADLRQKG